MDPADLRIGDAERESATTELGDHYAAGRLDHDEYSERLDAIWAARTRRELDPLFVDLRPVPARPAVRAPSWGVPPSRAPRRRGGLPTPLLVVAAVLVALGVLTHLPWILLGLAVWFFVVRPRRHCGRSAGTGAARWS